MATKADFSTGEWGRLLQAPVAAGFSVMLADPDFTGILRELKALSRAFDRLEVPHEAEELVGSLVADLRAMSERKEHLPGSEDFTEGRPEEIRVRILEDLRGIGPILAARATPGEAAGFREWLIGIGRAVAEASREGGFLGIGGARVSEKEKAALRELAEVLGAPLPAAV
ncbi:MAG: hypothetical protein PHP59_04790 [Methanofollis sp.]|uniref:hypothetical protein n=1 Tax=Methanofollis sp. TaxID=2052835 RepID=UPI002607FA84|nr:hypothetical protein [Methanofollis sp.]MDD4254677.1 hypothetical protein [Methanofollis sp.]